MFGFAKKCLEEILQATLLVKFEDKWKEPGQTQDHIKVVFGYAEDKRNREM